MRKKSKESYIGGDLRTKMYHIEGEQKVIEGSGGGRSGVMVIIG